VQHFGWFRIPSRRSLSEPVQCLDSTPTDPTYIYRLFLLNVILCIRVLYPLGKYGIRPGSNVILINTVSFRVTTGITEYLVKQRKRLVKDILDFAVTIEIK
jgi:hypothetical protein